MCMDNILELSEEYIIFLYITPSVLEKGWSVEEIIMETKVKLTDGKINFRGLQSSYPIAIIEAKDVDHSGCFEFDSTMKDALFAKNVVF